MLRALEATDKPFVVVANKSDKVKKSKAEARWRELRALLQGHKLIPYSSDKGVGQKELADELFRSV
jgi:GTP-binding protein